MHSKQVILSVKNVKKYFVLPQFKKTSVKNVFVDIFRRGAKKTHQKVLDGVSFDVYRGDFFGIVGRNGSGKSTLLKILAGVYQPSGGNVELGGKLTPFIELGVGFNPELSGRDNVYLNGALLGFTRKQMDEMYDEIVDFAELEPFMDQKLKNYSSGMQVRLAFSIAIKAKNEILIFDEVLAVGDEAFQRKCLDVFEEYKATGQTVILVTHDMDTVRQFCNRAILIQDGLILTEGNPREVANMYSQLNQASVDTVIDKKNKQNLSNLRVSIADAHGHNLNSCRVGDTVTIEVDWSRLKGDITSLGVNIFRQSGEHITGVNTLNEDVDVSSIKRLKVDFVTKFRPGRYNVVVEAFRGVGNVVDAQENAAPSFIVKKQNMRWSGLVDLPHTWHK